MDDFANFTGKNGTDWEKEAQKFVAGYRGKGEGDIMKDIYARAAEGKRNGTLTNEQIDVFYAQFAPMLDAQKRKRLKKLVDELKRM